MRLIDYIRTAFKNLGRQKLRTALTIVAVIIGTLAVVTLVSLVDSIKRTFVSQMEAVGAFTDITVMQETDIKIDGFGGGGDVQAKDGAKIITDTTVEDIEKLEHVVAVSPAINRLPFSNMRLKGEDQRYESYNVRGVLPNEAGTIELSYGEMFKKGERNKIVIGPMYADTFGYEDKHEELIGKTLVLTSWEGYIGEDLLPPEPCFGENCGREDSKDQWEKTQDFEAEIIGIGIAGPNDSDMLISLDWAKAFMVQKRYDSEWDDSTGTNTLTLIEENGLTTDGYSNLVVKVDTTDNTEALATKIEGLGYTTMTAKEFLEEFMNIFNIIGYILGIIGGISLLVASIGIVNTMVMSIYERTREIGVMRATGATKRAIRLLFTFEAAMIGFWGGVLGVGLGFGLGKIGNIFVNNLLSDQGMSATNVIQMPLWMMLGVIGFTTVIGLLAGLYPAARAARMNPVDALRYE